MKEDKETITAYDKNIKEYKDLIKHSYNDNNFELFQEMLKQKSVILDLGCGTGEASLKFQSLGHILFPIDASLEMVKVARKEFKLNAVQRTFEQIDEIDYYDGIWANFSLLHTKKKYFPGNLKKLFTALKHKGVFFFSLKSGTGESRDSLGRYYSYYLEKEVLDILNGIGFVVTNQTNGEDKGLAGIVEKWIGFFCVKR